MCYNGLAKFRGRLKELSNQTAKEASPVNLFIFFSKPNLGGLLVSINCTNSQVAHHRP
jgi:hypothetical protein